MLKNDKVTVKEAMQMRRSIRRFKPDPVPDELIRELLEAARLAPSGSNTQPWLFMVVKDREQRRVISELGGNQRQLREAPVIIVCCGDLQRLAPKSRVKRRQELLDVGIYEDIDASSGWFDNLYQQLAESKTTLMRLQANVYIAIEHMVLRATSLGLGTCWVGAFDRQRLHEYLQIPKNVYICTLLPVGYPAQNPAARPRLPLEEIIIEPPRV